MSRQFDATVAAALEIERELIALHDGGLEVHKARIAELEAQRRELFAKLPSVWTHGDLHIGRITSDGAALITFRLAAGEVPVHPPATAGQRLVEYLLRQEGEAKASP